MLHSLARSPLLQGALSCRSVRLKTFLMVVFSFKVCQIWLNFNSVVSACRLQLEAGEGAGTRPAHPVQPCGQGSEV